MNLKNFDINVEYKIGSLKFVSQNENEHFSLNVLNDGDSNRVTISIVPKQAFELLAFDICYKYSFDSNAVVYTNGYQSWTVSREWKYSDRQRGMLPPCSWKPFRRFGDSVGDYFFKSYPKENGIFHSYTYGYVRVGERVELLGSLSDRTGWTIINYDMKHGRIKVEKDVQGLVVDSEYKLFDLVANQGTYDEVFDKYFFEQLKVQKPRVDRMCGYTSWYNYFQKIDENIIIRDLKGLAKVGKAANIFQIDDGFEKFVGDWHELDEVKFPNGLKPIVDKIHQCGYKAGLWLAPFAAQFKAKVLKEHPEWILRDDKGKPIFAGIAWGGFYALDFYIPECAAYIKSCFDKVFDEWGFDMVKLDFLYSICMKPRNNKTRGQIMYEAVDFLRECCRDKLIMGCGVPLAPCFGVFDLCRISCDAELSFKEKYYTKFTNQEIISTKHSMNNTIFRRHLDGRAFVNDPDVFFLRDDNAKYTWQQKQLLAKINSMFGNILFVSDNVGDYDSQKLELLLQTYAKKDIEVISAEYIDSDSIQIVYKSNGEAYKLSFDTVSGEFSEKAY